MYLTKYHVIHKDSEKRHSVINTLTGDLCELSESELSFFDQYLISQNKLPISLEQKLIRKKLIYKNEDEEAKEIKYIREKCEQNAIENDPTIYVIYITYDCNITCNYCCYQYLKDQRKIIEENSLIKIFDAIKTIQQNSGRKKSRICLFGGEPLIKKNYKEISKYFSILRNHIQYEKEEGRICESMIFTNGVDIPFYESLLVQNKDIFSKVLITLIGNRDENDQRRKHFDGKGTFDDVKSGIDTLIKNQIPVWAVANIDKNNVHKIPDLINLVKTNGWHLTKYFAGYYIGRIKYYDSKNNSSISENDLLKTSIKYLKDDPVAQRIFNFGDIRNLKPILNLINNSTKPFQKFYACSSGNLQQFSFGSDGQIYTCSGAMGITNYALGTYTPSICINEKQRRFWTDRNVLSINKCKKCNVAFLCGGGCYYAAKVINGSEYKPICVPVEQLLHTYIDAKKAGITINYKDLLRD